MVVKDRYMIGREELNPEEVFLLELITEVGAERAVREDEFHAIMSIAVRTQVDSRYNFKISLWEDIDERYQTGRGALPYSPQLHEDIESLIRKSYLIRSAENPLLIFLDNNFLLDFQE